MDVHGLSGSLKLERHQLMFITRLNRLFEKHGKVAFVVMLFVIVGPFVFFIGSASLLDAMRGKTRGAPTHLVSINGKQMQESELHLHIVAESIRMEQMGMYRRPSVTELRQAAVDRMLMLREAKKQGLGNVTQEELIKSIRANPMVQTDGKFDQKKYNYFKMMIQAQYRITPSDYDTMASDDIVLTRLINKYSSEAEKALGADDPAIKKDYLENQTKYDCLTRRFMASDYEKQAEAACIAGFAKPEDRAAAAKKYYDATVEPMRADIEAQLTTGRGNDAIREAFQKVKQQLTNDLKLKDAEVEKQTSDYADKLTKVMPFFVRERKMVAVVAFPLADYPATATPEEISKEFTAGKDTNYKDKKLEDVSANIQKALVRQKSLAAAGKAATDFKNAVYAAAVNLADGQTVHGVFEVVAKEKNIKQQTSTWFDDAESTDAGINYVVAAKSYGEVSDVKPLSSVIDGSEACYVACWLGTKPALLPKFDDAAVAIQDKVAKVMAAEAAPKLAAKEAAEVAAALKIAPLVEADLVAKFKVEKNTLTRDADYNKILPGFKKMVPGEVSGPIETSPSMYMPASVMVAKLMNVTLPTDEEFNKAKAEYRQTMISREVSKKFNDLRERLRKENQVEFNRLAPDRR